MSLPVFDTAPGISAHRERAEAEFAAYYADFDPCTEPLLEKLRQMAAANPSASSYALKTKLYELLAEECPVHLFRESDFFFEISSGRTRFTWGGLDSPVGSFLHQSTADLWLNRYRAAIEKDMDEGFLYAWNNPVGFDHHCPGYDKLLSVGLTGIIREAEEHRAACADARKAEFYDCVVRANRALIRLALRFADEARRLAERSDRAHYEKIAAAAERVAVGPPRSFYEALCLILFYRECAGSIEGIGFSTFGQLDRMLEPYYTADLAAGRLTREDALRLFCDLLSYTEARFDNRHTVHETSTTIELGGCDREGNPVYNEVTDLILSAVMIVRSIGTKINCRISKRHPREYLERIACVQQSDLPTLMMHNDDVLIPARVRQGQQVEDARMYVGGGCHEIVLQGTEVCTRADTWISLPRILLRTLETAGDCGTYEEFQEKYIRDVRAYHDRIAALKNEQEQHWCEYDPLVLYSSTLTGCLEQGKDATEGGAKYNTTALSMLGVATAIDSLYAVKALVYDEKRLSLGEFSQIVQANFEGNESLRQYIIRRLPKHGTADARIDGFSAEVLAELSTVSGQRNARGGRYLPAVYPHNIFMMLGRKIGATPDGRLAGTPLSRGASPSEFITTKSPVDVIHSLRGIDFTAFADSFCTELTVPLLEDDEKGVQVLTAIIEAFLDAGGSSLQFNLINAGVLQDAKAHPERYPNLCVRVCGFSALFIALKPGTQDEVIARAIR